MSNYLIILSGGVGSRMKSDRPKQYIEINGRPILYYTLQCFDISLFEKIVFVVADSWTDYVKEKVCNGVDSSILLFAPAGSSRQESILNGLNALKNIAADEDVVVIHDAARPCLSRNLISSLIEKNKIYDGVMPVLGMKDTVYLSKDRKSITSLLNRDELYLGQSPESFKFGKYYQINSKLTKEELAQVRGSSEIAFKNKLSVGLIEGDDGNFKITTVSDLERFKQLILGK